MVPLRQSVNLIWCQFNCIVQGVSWTPEELVQLYIDRRNLIDQKYMYRRNLILEYWEIFL